MRKGCKSGRRRLKQPCLAVTPSVCEPRYTSFCTPGGETATGDWRNFFDGSNQKKLAKMEKVAKQGLMGAGLTHLGQSAPREACDMSRHLQKLTYLLSQYFAMIVKDADSDILL